MSTTTPPLTLIAAFKAVIEQRDARGRPTGIEALATLTVDEGFDAQAMRVLAAWEHTDHEWRAPAKPCPDQGKPTNAAWRWLRSGWSIDILAVAAAADVSSQVARAKLELLLGARLIYPDGSMAAQARLALKAHVGSKMKGRKKKRADEDEPKSDGEGAN